MFWTWGGLTPLTPNGIIHWEVPPERDPLTLFHTYPYPLVSLCCIKANIQKLVNTQCLTLMIHLVLFTCKRLGCFLRSNTDDDELLIDVKNLKTLLWLSFIDMYSFGCRKQVLCLTENASKVQAGFRSIKTFYRENTLKAKLWHIHIDIYFYTVEDEWWKISVCPTSAMTPEFLLQCASVRTEDDPLPHGQGAWQTWTSLSPENIRHMTVMLKMTCVFCWLKF